MRHAREHPRLPAAADIIRAETAVCHARPIQPAQVRPRSPATADIIRTVLLVQDVRRAVQLVLRQPNARHVLPARSLTEVALTTVTTGVLLTTPAAKDTGNPNPAAAVKNALPTRNAAPAPAVVPDPLREPAKKSATDWCHVLCAPLTKSIIAALARPVINVLWTEQRASVIRELRKCVMNDNDLS